MSRVRSFALALVVVAHLAPLACSQVIDVDRFHERATTPPASTGSTGNQQFRDLQLTFAGMKPHLAHTFEYRVIDANNLVQSRGIVTPLGAAEVTIFIPRAIPKSNGPYRLDFFADVNGSGGFDGIGSVISNDHAWRIEPLVDYPAGTVTPVDGLVQVMFTHSTSFTDIDSYPSGTPNKTKDTGLPAKVHLASLQGVAGKMLELRVAEKDTRHVVGLARFPAVSATTLDVTIPGVVDVSVDYEVDVYVDTNDNGVYDDPSKPAGDWGCRFGGSSTDTGLSLSADMSATVNEVDVGKP